MRNKIQFQRKYIKDLAKLMFLVTFLFSANASFGQEVVVEKTAVENTSCNQFNITLSITGNPPPQPQEVMLIIDKSGSMGNGASPTPMESAKAAAIEFVNNFFDNNPTGLNKIGVVSYDKNALLNLPLTLNDVTDAGRTAAIAAINGITIASSSARTNTEDGIVKADNEITTNGTFDCTTSRSIILLSDGVPTSYNTGDCSALDDQNTTCVQNAIAAGLAAQTTVIGTETFNQSVFTIGLFGAIDDEPFLIESTARYTLTNIQNAGFFETEDNADLTGIYSNILGQLVAAATQLPGAPLVTDTVQTGFSVVGGVGGITTDKGTATMSDQTISWDLENVFNETVSMSYTIVADDTSFCGTSPSGTSTIDYLDSDCTTKSITFDDPQICIPCPEITPTITRSGCNTIDYTSGLVPGDCVPDSETYAWEFFLDATSIGTSTSESGTFTYTDTPPFQGNFTAKLTYSGIYPGSCPAKVVEQTTTPINLPTVVSASVTSKTDVDCIGNSTGEIIVTATNGTSPYLYSIDGGTNYQASGTFSNLAAGTYSVEVHDNFDCIYIVSNIIIGTTDTEDPEISAPTPLNFEGCDENDITVANARYPYSSTQSSDIKATFTDVVGYTASDDVTIASITYIDVITSGSSCPLEVIRTFTITDGCNNTATFEQAITVEDTTPPEITCPTSFEQPTDAGEDFATVTVPLPTGISDTCGSVTYSNDYTGVEDASGTYNIGTTTVIYTATDDCGNTKQCSFIVTVNDEEAPVINCPPTITVDCITNVPAAYANYAEFVVAGGSATDNSDSGLIPGVDPTSFELTSESSISDSCNKKIFRVYSISDFAGNPSSCTQEIIVNDTTDPVLTLPADVTVECDAIPAVGTPTATDNCDTAVDIVYDGEVRTDGACTDTYTLTRTWTATDNCSNTHTLSQTINVQDTTDPVLTLPADVTVECDAIPAIGTPTATDNCDTAVDIVYDGEVRTDGACTDTYTLTRTWTATDNCSNTHTLSQTINVQDTTDPVLTLPADVTVECDAIPAVGTPTATDNCDTAVDIVYDGEVRTDGACTDTYTLTRTWTATDNCSNTHTLSQTINVQDTTDPVLTLPADVTVECDAIPAVGTPTATDNCDTAVDIVYDGEVRTDGACTDTYTLTRTWTATDNCSNTHTLSQTINVQDTTDPVLTLPADVTVECDAIPAVGTPTATDNCDTAVDIVYDGEVRTDGACTDTYTLTRTWTATDNCSNTHTLSQTINVQDTTDPVLTLPADVTVECDAIPAVGTPTATDNCDTAVDIVYDGEVRTDGACTDTYTLTRTWTATDNCSNTHTLSQTINVQDTTDPVLTLPADVTVECDAIPAVGTPTATDNCDTAVDIVYDGEVRTDGACTDTYTLTRTWTATDNCSNTHTLSQTINVQDTTDPVLTLPADVTVECDAIPAVGTPTATDNCDTAVDIVYDGEVRTDGACTDTYTLTRTWTATDNCSNTHTLSQTINVQDTTDPVLTLPADVTVECDAIPAVGTPTATDNCDTAVDIVYDGEVRTDGACTDTYTLTRTWTATDNCSNTHTLSQTINVQDTTDPVLTLPADVTIECTEDESSANTGVATGSDTCGDVIITESSSEIADCGNTKVITRTWTATDDCGNTTSANQIITVEDTTAPTLVLPADVTIECTEDESSANTGVATGSDTCGDVIITESSSEIADCGNTKVITRTWTATDDCGNTTSANQIITVEDTTAPTLVLPADVTIECTEDESSANTGVATGSDTCGDVIITESSSEIADCGNTKVITRTWTATDDCGNTTSANQIITVEDTTAPTLVLPADVTIECTEDESSANTGVATGSDTCGDVIITESSSEVADCGNTKVITRTWTATDDCGNTTSANQIITVEDATAPTLVLPADVTIECTEDESSANTGVATGSDTCGDVIITESSSEIADCGNTKVITRTWTATDDCGNTTSANQIITVEDTTAPTLVLPADVTIECTEDESSANTGVATGSDTCGDVIITESSSEVADCGNTKVITRTWTATDDCGNTTSANQIITVEDTTAPTLVLPADVTIECTEDESSANTGVATGSDTCGSVTITETDTESDGCGNTKTITRTWTATDECGNSASAVQTITVEDTTAPVMNTNASDIVVECDGSGNTSAIQAWLDSNGGAAATDSCGNVTWTNDYNNAGSDCANPITVIFTATDECGNTTTTSATYAIQDTIAPSIDTEASDSTVECDGFSNTTDINNWLASNGGAISSDDCSSITWTNDFTSLTDACGATGSATVIFTATDGCGNSSSTTATFTIEDTTAPTLVLPADVTIECTEDESSANTGVATGSDTCGDVIITESSSEIADCGNTKVITRTWTATDDCGNTTSANQIITVEDTTAPTLVLPADVTIECTEDESSANTGVATGSDTCGDVIITESSSEIADCGNTKVITRTWTATDDCGNTTSANQIITVEDTTAPTLVLPADVTIECTEDESSANTGVATGSDTCGDVIITESSSEVADCGSTKVITRTWTATDDCGNTTSANQIITVEDTTAPTLVLPADVTIECTEDESSANTGVATGSDTCGDVIITESSSEIADCGNTKVITRTWTATDDCGNTTSANQIITVEDTTAPTLVLPADVTIECTEDESSANTGVATGSDTCGDVIITESSSEIADCGNTKVITRTWTATDDCGNTTSANQIITVEDTTAPTLVLPADVTIECTEDESSANTGVATGSDTCGDVIITESSSEVADCGNTKVITRTWTATDDCGNTTSANQIITVEDATAPTLVLPADVTIECTEDESSANTGVATGSDTCGDVIITESSSEIADCGNTKVITRTWTATDDCGNTTSANQIITVEDTTAPTLVLPADVTIECTEDESSANTGVATGSDTCGSVTITETDTESDGCGNTKTITRTWTATDECGNSASAVQTITVEDTTAPVMNTNASDIVVECDGSGNTSAIQAWLDSNGGAAATDSCGNVTWTNDYNNAGSDCANPITVIFTATDECGNTTTTSATYAIQDTIAPSIDTEASDSTVECDGFSNTTDINNWLASNGGAISSDDCSSITWTNDFTSLTDACGATGSATVIFTATDGCGNSSSTTATFTIEDTTAPTLVLPADVTIECTEDESSANTGVATGSDTCGDVIITESSSEIADCGNTKVITRTWTATDDCGNTTSANQIITVEDTTAPTLVLPADVTIECTEDESSANTGVATGSDTCGDVIITESSSEIADCGNTKVITRTWTATDDCGNTTSANQIITVEDTTAPTLVLPADVTIECTEDESSANTGVATGSDTCGDVIITESSSEIADCGNTKVITRTWTATDDCGNTTSANQIITVEDTTAPTLVLPADVTIECTEDESSANTGVATGSDTCGDVIITESSSEVADCGNTKVITRTWTATDDCGNTTSADQIITVEDTTNPVIDSVANNITVECNGNGNITELNSWLVSNGGATASDMCGVVTWSNDFASISDACGETGSATVIFTATDECGNTSSTSATFTIEDTTLPVLSLPNNVTAECSDDLSPIAFGTATAEDNCDSNPIITFNDVRSDGNCSGTYTITRTWTATDACGNTVSADQTISTSDTTAPVFDQISLPMDLVVECNNVPEAETLTATDNCGDATVTLEEVKTNGNCDNNYTITRTYTATDECGLTKTHVQLITVQDTTPPTFVETLPIANIVVECDAVPTAETLTAIDICGSASVTVSDARTDGSCPNSYTLARTWTAKDECGLTTTHTQNIIVQDTTPPAFVEALPRDTTVECDALPDVTTLTATDNCGDAFVSVSDVRTNGTCPSDYTIARTWTATDECGLTTTHTQIITVQDTTAPVPTSNFDAILDVSCTDIPEAPALEFTDNCSSNVIVVFNETNSFDENVIADYQITRTWTVRDACNNEDVYTQTLNVALDEILNEVVAQDRCFDNGVINLDDFLADNVFGGAWEIIEGNPVATINGSIFDPTNLLSEYSEEFNPNTDGIQYVLRHTGFQSGCINITDVLMVIDAKCRVLPCGEKDISITTAITPNGDGFNESFDINGIDLCGFVAEVKIFNRWGALVYESNDYTLGSIKAGSGVFGDWNGSSPKSSIGNKGKLPNGTYYYIINLRNSGLNPLTGPIYLGTK